MVINYCIERTALFEQIPRYVASVLRGRVRVHRSAIERLDDGSLLAIAYRNAA